MKLDLIYPCHENVNNMPNTDKGKFCGQCSKEVVDFTAMSKDEVLNHLTKKKTCGIFRNDQLDKVHEPVVHIRPKKHFVRMALASLSVFMLSVVGCDAQSTNHGDKKTNGEDCNKETKSKGQTITMGKPVNPEILVGDIIDIGEPAPVDTNKIIIEEIETKRGEVVADPQMPIHTTAGVPVQQLEPDLLGDVALVDEPMPEFPGGEEALKKFLSKNIKYPKNETAQGRVTITFMVQKDGSLSNLKVERSVSERIDEEALRVIKLMPNWSPGYQNGEPTKIAYTLPIEFSLD